MDPIGSVNGLVMDGVDPLILARFWSDFFSTEVDSEDVLCRSAMPTTAGNFPMMADPEGNEFCLIEQAVGREGDTLGRR